MSVAIFFVMRWRGCSCHPQDMPTFPWSVVEVTVFTLVEEIGFYYTHRFVVVVTVFTLVEGIGFYYTHRFVVEVTVYTQVEEIGFYYTHRSVAVVTVFTWWKRLASTTHTGL